MARFVGTPPDYLIKRFEHLNVNTEKMLSEMVEAGAEVALKNIKAKMPTNFRDALTDDNFVITRVYKTPSDGGINCQAAIDGYFTNSEGKKTPAPLVANMFEYGSDKRDYPKQPFLRLSFKKGEIEKAMQKVQEKYLKGLED